MGQKKGLIYNALVLTFLFTIWYFTTSKPGYTPQPIKLADYRHSALDLTPTDLTLIVCSTSEVLIPAETLLKIEQISNTFSQFWDLSLNLKFTISNSPQKIKNSSQSVKRVKSLIFFVDEGHFDYSEDNIISLFLSEVHDIPYYLIGYLRTLSALGVSDGVLVNGLTESEHGSVEAMLDEWLDSQIYKESKIFNNLIIYNEPKISKKQYESLEGIKNSINSKVITDKYSIWKAISSLNSDPNLSKAPHFQWDFKLGVYAPIFFPVIFPICGAVYSRLFLRK